MHQQKKERFTTKSLENIFNRSSVIIKPLLDYLI